MTQQDRDFHAQEALRIMQETKESLFLTGKAGTGKSTLIKHFIKNTSKNLLLLAPTGIAAMNVEGSTIHSFFLIHPGITLQEAENEHTLTKNRKDVLEKVDTIIIDEVSMVRADLLDVVDICMRKTLKSTKPFGGVQMIFVGDLYQLPPIVRGEESHYFREYYEAPYFFASHAYKQLIPQVVELQKIYRQDDEQFKLILNKMRL